MCYFAFTWTSPNEGKTYELEDIVELSEDVTYNSSEERFEIRCDITISSNDTLKVNPGENVMFFRAENNYKQGLYIEGCILAIGEPENPILFGEKNADWDAERWLGIKFTNTSLDGESKLIYCDFKGAGGIINPTGALAFYNASPIISHCNFSIVSTNIETNGICYVMCFNESSPLIMYSVFEKLTKTGVLTCVAGSNPLFIGCDFMPSIVPGSVWTEGDIIFLFGGFFDNCYIAVNESEADTTLGAPVDTVGDGICDTNSTFYRPRYWSIDGVKNPRNAPITSSINGEINILPTTSKYLILEQNFPNPFNPSTTLDFTVKENNIPVTLEIFNSKGEKINTLVNRKIFSKGKHTQVWSGKDKLGQKVPSGVYFYKISTKNEVLVKKAILVK